MKSGPARGTVQVSQPCEGPSVGVPPAPQCKSGSSPSPPCQVSQAPGTLTVTLISHHACASFCQGSGAAGVAASGAENTRTCSSRSGVRGAYAPIQHAPPLGSSQSSPALHKHSRVRFPRRPRRSRPAKSSCSPPNPGPLPRHWRADTLSLARGRVCRCRGGCRVAVVAASKKQRERKD